jgi:hypothetical protein
MVEGMVEGVYLGFLDLDIDMEDFFHLLLFLVMKAT